MTPSPQAPTPCALRMILTTGLCLTVGCGGPDLAFDPAPAPGWTRGLLKTEPGRITATGSTQASQQIATDFELARRDALHQVAASIQAQVAGHTSSYEAHIATGDKTVSEDVVSRTVDLRTRLPVEGAKVAATYRDKGTATAYVLVEVDTSLWASNVQKRLERALAHITDELARTMGLGFARGGVFEGLKNAAVVRGALRAATVDVSVMEVLKPAANYGARLREKAEGLALTVRRLKERTPFLITIQGGDKGTRDGLHSQLRAFIGERGFPVVQQARSGAVSVEITLSHQDKGAQRVGNRTEYVAVARGSLRVRDPAGRDVPALAYELSGSMVEERAPDANQAALAAQRLAADTLVSQLRSRFRRLVASEPQAP